MLFLQPTTGMLSGGQSSIKILTRCFKRLDSVAVCNVGFSALGSEFSAPNHFLRERGVEHRLLLAKLFRGCLAIVDSLLFRSCEGQRCRGQLRAQAVRIRDRFRQLGFERTRRVSRVGLLSVGPLFSRLQRHTSGRHRRCVLVLELTTGIVCGHQSSVEVLTGRFERLNGVSVCKIAFSELGSQCLASSHFVRERGVELRPLLGSLVRGRLSIGGGLVFGELSGRFLIGKLSSKGCLLRARSPFETSQRDHGVGKLALERARDARRVCQPRVGLFLNLFDPCLGVGPGRCVQLVGEPEDTLGLGELLLEALCLTGGIRKLLRQRGFVSVTVLARSDDIGRAVVPCLFERRHGVTQFLFEPLPQGRRIGQLHVTPTEVLGEARGFLHTTTVGVAVCGFGLLTRRLDVRKALLQLNANGTLLLDGGLQRLLAGVQLVERLLSPLFGTRGDGFTIAQPLLKVFVTWRGQDLLNLRLREGEGAPDGLRQLVEKRGISRHDLVGNGSHRHQQIAGANQRNPNHGDLDAEAARVGDERFQVPGVGFDLDDQGRDVAILVNPVSRLTQGVGPGDSYIRSDGAESQTGFFRRLAFARDIEKFHAEQFQQDTWGASGWLSV